MKFTTLLTGIAAFAFVGTASAVDRTWDGSGDGSSWTDRFNWSSDDAPDSTTERAVIPNSGGTPYVVNLDSNITCGGLEVYETSTVNIAPSASATLTIDAGIGTNGLVILRATSSSVFAVVNVGDDDADHQGILRLADTTAAHPIGGDIVLKEADSMLDVENESMTFAPYNDAGTNRFGSVAGKDNAALVQIDSGFTLTNQIYFEGAMEIEAETNTATFMNDRLTSSADSGNVWANLEGGTLTLDSNLDLVESEGPGGENPVWKASLFETARLEFYRSETSLLGDFVLEDCADMQFEQNVTTTGSFSSPAGQVIVAPGITGFTVPGPTVYGPGTTHLGGC